ncbi:MAG: lysylphosphatidylglycerol synthase transmembrane domain-containing protein [Candidatus Acidiferrum sp.]
MLLVLGYVIYRSSGMIHGASFSGTKLLHAVRTANPYLLLLSIVAIYACYAIRALRWKVFQGNLGPSRFLQIYSMTLAGFTAIFLLGRAGELVRPTLLARKERLPVADMFGIYALERIFDFASMAVIASIGLFLFQSRGHASPAATALEAAAKTAGLVFSGAVVVAIIFLIYLRLHGTALLERRLQNWHAAHGWRAVTARVLLGFVRGVQAIRSVRELAAALFYSAAHWFLVAMIYLWVSHAFGGRLASLTLGDAMLVLAFTLAGSAVQLPGVGGGAQVATFLAYTTVLGVNQESAAAAAIVLWLISFAACSLAGVPLLLREGFSPGKLREMAEHEKQEMEA